MLAVAPTGVASGPFTRKGIAPVAGATALPAKAILDPISITMVNNEPSNFAFIGLFPLDQYKFGFGLCAFAGYMRHYLWSRLVITTPFHSHRRMKILAVWNPHLFPPQIFHFLSPFTAGLRLW
jgi:hypothetical protein